MFKRCLRTFKTSTTSPLVISEEVQQALSENKPIVSLESTILTHGFPYPENLSLGMEFENIVRDNGGIPATIAFIKGIPHVGLKPDQLSYLTENYKSAIKVSRRDIGHVMAHKLNGATTIASTSMLSCMAGIKVFGTGGLGGVHREGQFTMDVSNDLVELGRNPITVVCAGPKSILDIGLTMEFLETQGVYVTTFDDEGTNSDIQIPGFYARKSGIKSPNRFNDFNQVANIIYNQNLMNLQSGNIVCIPPPKEDAMDLDFINKIIEDANEEAKQLGIRGKDVTPFLLLKIGEMTKGDSLRANKNFVKNNIACATKIATELSNLETTSSFQPQLTPSTADQPVVTPVEATVNLNSIENLVIGSVALDTISKLGDYHMHDSNPGSTKTSVGGVGHNVSLASYYTGGRTKFLSVIGDDYTGKILNDLIKMDHRLFTKPGSSASYTSIHDSKGDLIIASADMKIIETEFSKEVKQEIIDIKPKNIVLDCNLSVTTMQEIIDSSKDCNIIIEPTSLVKSKKIGELDLDIHNSIQLITPTINELNAIYDIVQTRELFNDEWFEIIDDLELYKVRDLLNGGMIKKLYDEGVIQKALKLLPFINNLLIKLGDKGVLSIGIKRSNFFNLSKHDKVNDISFYLKHYPIPRENENLNIVNVTGAGDTFLGYILSHINDNVPLDEMIYKAQLLSGLSITYEEAINPSIELV